MKSTVDELESEAHIARRGVALRGLPTRSSSRPEGLLRGVIPELAGAPRPQAETVEIFIAGSLQKDAGESLRGSAGDRQVDDPVKILEPVRRQDDTGS
ncbi:MAG: hypothetical protein MK133_03935 [Planctomycetes bacterium]|nr:hypothetical protein [Planctomycetota bacterium]